MTTPTNTPAQRQMEEEMASELQAIVDELQRRLAPTNRRKDEDFLALAPAVKCADGLTMSVQASAYHYCAPRNSDGPWYKVEVGFPSREVPEIRQWMEDWGNTPPTDAVYGYVPIEEVARAILNAGGLAAQEAAQ